MRFFFITLIILPLSVFSQDTRFSLYLVNRNSEGVIENNSLKLTGQVFYLQKTDSTLRLYNDALTVDCFGDTTDIYFDGVLVDSYTSKLWKDPHYYIIEFTVNNTFYFFYEIFPFMHR